MVDVLLIPKTTDEDAGTDDCSAARLTLGSSRTRRIEANILTALYRLFPREDGDRAFGVILGKLRLPIQIRDL